MSCNSKSSDSKHHSSSKRGSIPNISSSIPKISSSTSISNSSSLTSSNTNKCCSSKSYTSWSGCKCSSSSKSKCKREYERVYPKKCCDSNPLYSLTPAQLDRINLMSKQFVNPNGTSSGNMLSQGYGIIPGIATPTIFSGSINY